MSHLVLYNLIECENSKQNKTIVLNVLMANGQQFGAFEILTCRESLSVRIWHKSLWLHPYRATSHRLLLFSSLSYVWPRCLNHTNELDFTCQLHHYLQNIHQMLYILHTKNVLANVSIFTKYSLLFVVLYHDRARLSSKRVWLLNVWR